MLSELFDVGAAVPRLYELGSMGGVVVFDFDGRIVRAVPLGVLPRGFPPLLSRRAEIESGERDTGECVCECCRVRKDCRRLREREKTLKAEAVYDKYIGQRPESVVRTRQDGTAAAVASALLALV